MYVSLYCSCVHEVGVTHPQGLSNMNKYHSNGKSLYWSVFYLHHHLLVWMIMNLYMHIRVHVCMGRCMADMKHPHCKCEEQQREQQNQMQKDDLSNMVEHAA